ncbi:pentatricopeptide repeat-containing protein At4g18975, chloroplastic isoform X2 [Cryptomeria japonica]|uniref:pentatricopeptide repeat-containing protein At4g18975, chloroplastic isoform X2 n=1 Tax=Cryptomeria japonica TaxID=3369 RepID=UPI0027DA67AB|nr:pentatricopeptide repeat-containing protein At4g18975, chloroplastic isoform X2 [Cryptomeria japonica]
MLKFRYLELISLRVSPTRKALKVSLKARQNKSPSRNLNQKAPPKQLHLWKRKSTSGSGKSSRALVDTVMKLSNDKCSVYGALDQWVAWEEEFPLIVLTKALGILKQRCQWKRIIQVAKWMLSKGQGMTMGTYDTMILAFDMEGRVDEAQALWDIISSKYSRSIPKMLFSRMISMYEKHNMPGRLLEIFMDMEELDIRPDETTLKKVGYAFLRMGFKDKRNEVLMKYKPKWKYLHFNGEQVRVRREDLENMQKL